MSFCSSHGISSYMRWPVGVAAWIGHSWVGLMAQWVTEEKNTVGCWETHGVGAHECYCWRVVFWVYE